MALSKKTFLYEFLARIQEGVITGAHVKYRTVVKDGATVLSDAEGPAQAVSLAGEDLAKVMSEVHIAAQARIEQLTAELAQAKDSLAETRSQLGEAESAMETASATIASLSSELTAARAAVAQQSA